jgi:glucarate dehydratase
MPMPRRDWLRLGALGLIAGQAHARALASLAGETRPPLKITALKVTPVALPDPPILAASGCHGPYFLRNVVEIETDAGIVGIGETAGGEGVTRSLERAREVIVGRDAFAYRGFAREVIALSQAAYAAIEIACLDAACKATGRRLCDLLGGPVRPSVEFAAYLFYRYAADNPTVLADPHLVDKRGKGAAALDDWGEVRTPSAMAEMAARFRDRWGFRVFKLKGGVLPPDAELETMKAMARRLGPKALLRIDPNARWRVPTALRIGKGLVGLPLEYYEDPVGGQAAMAEVRAGTGLKMSTNMCVTRFGDLALALRVRPIDVLLADLHYFDGFAGCLALGPVCDAAGWSMSQHSNSHAGLSMAAMIHLGAACPQLTLASDTHYPWLPEDADLIEGPKLPIEGGRMEIPPGPGLGVSLDRDKLSRAHEVYRKCGMRGRDDSALMRRLEPGWDGRPF